VAGRMGGGSLDAMATTAHDRWYRTDASMFGFL
jgi:hypothetical protein